MTSTAVDNTLCEVGGLARHGKAFSASNFTSAGVAEGEGEVVGRLGTNPDRSDEVGREELAVVCSTRAEVLAELSA